MKVSLLSLAFLLSLATASQAAGLSRLFTTAQERSALNEERSKPPPVVIKQTTQAAPALPKPPRYITFNGLVVRSQGPSTVWINGYNELYQPGFQVKLTERQELTVPIILMNSKRILSLKPGQTANTLDGSIKENFEQPGIQNRQSLNPSSK